MSVCPLPPLESACQPRTHPSRSAHGAELSFRCYTAASRWLCSASEHVVVCIWQCASLSSFRALLSDPMSARLLSTSALCPCPANKSLAPFSQIPYIMCRSFPSRSAGEESTCNAGETGNAGLIRGLGRSPGGGNGKPLQYYHLKNPMGRGAWRATVHGVAKRWTRLSN